MEWYWTLCPPIIDSANALWNQIANPPHRIAADSIHIIPVGDEAGKRELVANAQRVSSQLSLSKDKKHLIIRR